MAVHAICVGSSLSLRQGDRAFVAGTTANRRHCREAVGSMTGRTGIVASPKSRRQADDRLFRGVALHAGGGVDRPIMPGMAVRAGRALGLPAVVDVDPLVTSLAIEHSVLDRVMGVVALRACDRGVHRQSVVRRGVKRPMAPSAVPRPKHVIVALEHVAGHAIGGLPVDLGVGPRCLLPVAGRTDAEVHVLEREREWVVAVVALDAVVDDVHGVARGKPIESPALRRGAGRSRLLLPLQLGDRALDSGRKKTEREGRHRDGDDGQSGSHSELA